MYKKNFKKRTLELAGHAIMASGVVGISIELLINMFFIDSHNIINVDPKPYIHSIDKSYIESEKVEEIAKFESNVIEEDESKQDIEDSNESDLYWLSHVIMAEEEGACYLNKLMCGLVVLNRVNDPDFPNTIQEVIFQKNQYASVLSVNNKDPRIYLEPNQDSISAAEEILSGNCSIIVPDDIVYQSEYVLGSGLYMQIENQCYSRK